MLPEGARRRLRAATAALVLVAALGPVGAAAAPAPADDPVPTQLPRGVRPLHYDVALVPDAAALRFAGRVDVTIDVLMPTTAITLNAVDLAFASAQLSRAGARAAVAPTRIDVNAADQTATFVFARPIRPGRHRLSMRYSGVIGKQPQGLFAVDYASPDGPKRALYTQFENSDARRVIPSWDEPFYKATFALQATVPEAQMAVSNLPAARTARAGPGLATVHFATTPRMPTYLLFFAAGDFERATMQAGATEIGVVTRRGVVAQARFALDSTRDILREQEAYFGLPFPLPKLDNVASPSGSAFFAAMENWGAIFTFERGILIDPALSTAFDPPNVFSNAAHEIAHQWFGNLVTMRWWDDIWLNEGFATWMERRTMTRLHPEWDTEIGEVAGRGRAMASDAFSSTHAIVQPVATVEQADQVFDEITYSKAASVIAMLESYVGADAWRDGVRRYLRAHAYGSTKSDDLWREIDAVSSRPVAAIARDFTRQPGVPLLRVVASRCDEGRTTLELEQGELSLDQPERTPLRWQIPVIARVVGAAPARTLVAGGTGGLVLEGCGAVIANAGQSGYYRTSYPPELRAALRDAFGHLAPIDQLGVLDDAWALGLAGLTPIGDALDLVARVPVDADASLWLGVVDKVLALDELHRLEPARRDAWRRFAIARLAPVLARIGWQQAADERTTTTVLRSRLIAALGELGDDATVAESRRRYAGRASDPEGYPPALRKTILELIAARADSVAWDAMRAEAAAETSPLAKGGLYRALAGVLDESLARRVLELSLGDEPGAGNGGQMLAAVGESHPELAFDFALAHADAVERVATNGPLFFPRLASASVDPAVAERLEAFARARFPADARRPAQAAAQLIRYRATVVRERLPAIETWLGAQRPPG